MNFAPRLAQDLKEFVDGPVDPGLQDWLEERAYYITGEFADAKTYQQLKELLQTVNKEHGTHGNYFYYLATAPDFFGPIVEQLSSIGLMTEENHQWRRVIVEKPFGRDLESAKALNEQLLKVVNESQIYRIDHYLGKETVQNILAFRFANGIFEPIWNRRYIDHVQITVAETVGVELRGGYYDTAGALRDMVPNHIMQLISLTAMEPPISFQADAVRDEQAKILHAIQPLSSEDVLTRTVRGQYGEGEIAGQHVPAYRSEPGVPPDSRTETFVAVKLQVDNWRWAGVPFYLRTGKRLASRSTYIVIQFRRAPFVLFRDTEVEKLMPNQLILHIQPEEGIALRFAAKTPGPVDAVGDGGHGLRIRRLLWQAVEYRLRAFAARLHGGRRYSFSTRRHGGSGMERGQPDAGFVEGFAAAQFPQLCLGHMGTERLRRVDGARRATLEELREVSSGKL